MCKYTYCLAVHIASKDRSFRLLPMLEFRKKGLFLIYLPTPVYNNRSPTALLQILKYTEMKGSVQHHTSVKNKFRRH